MIYSKTCEYAVRTLTYLAHQEKGACRGALEISKAIGAPGPYISKICQSLARKRILKSRRGAFGGFVLSRDPKKLSLMQIIDAIDDLTPLDDCAMGLDQCEDDNGCPMHEIWKKAKNEIILKFKNTKLSEIKKTSIASQYRSLKRAKLKAATS